MVRNRKSGGNPRAYTASRKSKQHNFSAPASNRLPTQYYTSPAVSGSAAQQTNNSQFVNWLNGISDFQDMTRETLVEHMYTAEPEIATAVDSFALMVRNAFQFFDIVNYSEIESIPDKLEVDDDTTLDFTKGKDLAKEMIDVANAIAKEQDIPSLYEQYAAVMKLHGSLFLLISETGTLTQLPNDHVTIVDNRDRITGMGNYGNTEYEDLITQANYLVLDENLDTQRIYDKTKFMIVRYHDTPVYIEDIKGRYTYGIYGVSPLRRALIPVWYRRILIANDALTRYKAVPRPHHQLSADSFNTGNYTGSQASRLNQAQAAALAAIESHKTNMENMPPDSAIITLDTTKIDMVQPSAATHLDANAAITQTTDEIYAAIGLPRSIIQGMSSSNYAGELVIYAHTNTKILQVASKISRAVLTAMKRKLLSINPEYPVDLLDINLNVDLAANELESSKIAQLMDSMDKWTDDEIRARMKYKPQTEEQKKEIEERKRKAMEQKQQSKTPDTGGELGATNDNGRVNYPTTSHSANKQPTDSAQSKINDALEVD